MINATAYGYIDNGYNGNKVQVSFRMKRNLPICSTKNGESWRCAFLPDLADESELIYCLTKIPKYSKYVSRLILATDWNKGKPFIFD